MASSSTNFQPHYRAPAYTVCLARTDKEILQCQQLRCEVFQGDREDIANHHGLDHAPVGLDCRQLMVKDNVRGKVIATASLKFEATINTPGRFDSESKFHMQSILTLTGRTMEIGRTCIHKEYCNRSVIKALWLGLASLIVIHKIDYVFTTVSVSTADGGQYAHMVAHYVNHHCIAPEMFRVVPKSRQGPNPLPTSFSTVLPSVLKTYLRYGAVVCGEPYWNIEENTAEFLLLLEHSAVNKRYQKALAEHI
jgi:putative hemolysin